LLDERDMIIMAKQHQWHNYSVGVSTDPGALPDDAARTEIEKLPLLGLMPSAAMRGWMPMM
jgi:hypothetical protein